MDGFSRISKLIDSLPNFVTNKTNVGECLDLLGYIKGKLNIEDIDQAIELLTSGKVKIYSKDKSKKLQKYQFEECELIVYIEM